MSKVALFFHRFWWLLPVIVYLYAFSTNLFLGFTYLGSLGKLTVGYMGLPGYSVLFPHEQSYATLLSLWDGQWYRDIVEFGYQFDYKLESQEPVNLAFFPLFPLLVKLFTSFGVPFWLAGSLINCAATLAAFLIVFRLAQRYSGSLWVGLFVVLPLALNPAFFVTMSTYTEGLGLLLVAIILHGLVNDRYRYVLIGLMLAAFTRGIGVPLFALILLVAAVHFWKTRKLERKQLAALLAATFAAGFWPLFVGVTLGSLTASLQILAFWTTSVKYPIWLIPLVALGVLVLHRLNKQLPWQWTLWSALYLSYIVATTVVSAGLIRYGLMALLPLPLLLEKLPRKYRTIGYSLGVLVLLAAGIYGQSWWLTHIWIRTATTWAGGIAIP